MQSHTQELAKYWLRKPGRSLALSRIQLLAELPPGEQLLAAILRCDLETFTSVAVTDGTICADRIDQFVREASRHQLTNLVLDRIFDLGLVSLMPADSLKKLTGMALRESADQQLKDQQFRQLLQLLAEHRDELVWIKGGALSRTVYEKATYRNYGDLDVVVRASAITPVIKALEQFGFARVDGPAFSSQYGIGPVYPTESIFLTPVSDWVPTTALSLQRVGWTVLDIKASPYDRGAQMVELDRFFVDSQLQKLQDQPFRSPSVVDSLIISLYTLQKDRFISWKTLLDVRLLCAEVARAQLWDAFTRCARRESLSVDCWAGLVMAVDRLKAAVPDAVLHELGQSRSLLSGFAAFTH
ncbi:MAG: nucleotidyltransferase family protein, partial [Terriglobales bacterium]